MNVGEKIKEHRKSKGLTQKEFGELFSPKVSMSTVYSWEKGISIPRGDNKIQIAKMANESVSNFFGSELIGKVYNELTVIDDLGTNFEGNARVIVCECSCGNIKKYSAGSVKSGNAKSCGHIKGNDPKDITGIKFGRLIAIERLERNKHGRYMWKCKCSCGKNVVVDINYLTSGHTKSCGCLKSELVSELGKNVTIYTKDFLEKDTIEKGTRLSMIDPNLKISKNNTSGKTGVSFNKRKKRWVSVIELKGKRIHLGYFENKEDAIKARLKAEEEYFVPILEKHKDVFEQ